MTGAGRVLRHSIMPVRFRNEEGHRAFDFTLPGGRWKAGVSAMLRVKNEERRIVDCLASIIGVFDQIVVVDNGSTDATLDLVRRFAHEQATEKIDIHSYPFTIARCGQENADTPEFSVHSLAYYYNWCRSRCSRRLVFKWDADMLLKDGAAEQLRSRLRLLPWFQPVVVSVPIQTIYHSGRNVFFAARGEVNCEPMIFTNVAAIRHRKAQRWETLRVHDIPVVRSALSEVLIYEIKDTEIDEFSHWTNAELFTERKKREWRNFNMVRSGNIPGDAFERVYLGRSGET
ncbi:MAG TPA: glycosyltransferase [Longimicrobiaceae bacterium]|nr:glycosyltransferase [Longimicrobiaceae bacterium]